jgi:hypothetical protein
MTPARADLPAVHAGVIDEIAEQLVHDGHRSIDRATIETVLAGAQHWLAGKLDAGEQCPTCAQHARSYRRRLTAPAAAALVTAFGRYGDRAFHAPSAIDSSRLGGEWARLAHWGLIEEVSPTWQCTHGHGGHWRVTHAGGLFATGRLNVRSHVVIYAGQLVDFAGREVNVDDALGTGFDRDELLGRPRVHDGQLSIEGSA